MHEKKKAGSIRLWKHLKESEIWIRHPLLLKMWVWLLFEANHPDRIEYGGKVPVAQGCVLATYKQLKEALKVRSGPNYSYPSNISLGNLLKTLKDMGMITRTKTQHGALITLCNYSAWNEFEEYEYLDENPTEYPDENHMLFSVPPTPPIPVPLPTTPPSSSLKESTPSKPSAQKAESSPQAEPVANPDIPVIAKHYQDKIHSSARLTDVARSKIKTRLKSYDAAKLMEAIDKFAGNVWRMETNATEGMAWFFHTDDRIEKFLGLAQDRRDDGLAEGERRIDEHTKIDSRGMYVHTE